MKNVTNFIFSFLLTALLFIFPVLFVLSIVLKWGLAVILIAGFSTIVAFFITMVLIGALLDCIFNGD